MPQILLLIIDHFPINDDNTRKMVAGKRRERPYACLPHLPVAANHARDVFRVPSVFLPCSCGNLRVLERSKRPLCCHFPFFGSLWMGLTEKRRTQSRAGSRNHDETPTAYHTRMLSCYPGHFFVLFLPACGVFT